LLGGTNGALRSLHGFWAPRQRHEKLLRQWQKMLPFNHHPLADAAAPLSDQALLIFLTSSQQLPVEVSPVRSLRHRHQMIAPEIAYFSFHSAFLVPTRRSAKGCLKAPMGAEGDEANRFFPLPTSQNLAHCTAQIVVPENSEDASKIIEGRFVRFQEGAARVARG
jgi:hypothetical protein